jgi:hypothetical protein
MARPAPAWIRPNFPRAPHPCSVTVEAEVSISRDVLLLLPGCFISAVPHWKRKRDAALGVEPWSSPGVVGAGFRDAALGVEPWSSPGVVGVGFRVPLLGLACLPIPTAGNRGGREVGLFCIGTAETGTDDMSTRLQTTRAGKKSRSAKLPSPVGNTSPLPFTRS